MRFAAALLAVGFLAIAGHPAGAQEEPSARERELEQLVRQLGQQVTDLEKRLQAVEASQGQPGPGGDVENRLGQLEQKVETIHTRPPGELTPEEITEMRKVVDTFGKGETMRPYWKEGLRFDSNDGSFQLKLGGFFQYDLGYFAGDSHIEETTGAIDAARSEIEDGSEFRRARINVSGSMYDNIDFKVEYDFAEGDARFTDVYMGIKKVPVVGNVRIGHFKEPFGLEELTSDLNVTFLERALPTVFDPVRNAGIMVHNTLLDERMTWAAGFFRETDDFANGAGSRDYNATARLTGLPWYEEEGRKLLHVGVAYTHKNFEDDVVRFRQRPEAHLAPRFVDTGTFPAEYSDTVGAELAWVCGPFSLQGEFMQAFVESRVASDPTFWGAYLQASYFLTGEHRPYDRVAGSFKGVKPKKNFGKDGWGAWEVAVRYSHLDLNDRILDFDGVDTSDGELRDFTVGLNWYLNPNARFMWNYVRADVAEDDAEDGGEIDIYQMRFQLSF
ncbi:MAG: porin [Phycisphaerales bacterium]|nr:porin [Phycisphaerales bacterium]